MEKGMMSKTIAWILTLVMVITMMPAQAFASSAIKHGTVEIEMLQETKDSPSMCDPLFAKNADVTVKDGIATLKVMVANPVPGFPDQGEDGTVKNFKIVYNDQEYKADSDIKTKPKMKAKADNSLFGLTKDLEYAAQVLTLNIPEAALAEEKLPVAAYVNVVMNSDVNFNMKLSNLKLEDSKDTGEDVETTVPKENYKINSNKYMTRLHDHWGDAELEFGFVVRFEGEDYDRFTPAMGENLLKSGQIKINEGEYWTFEKAGVQFAGKDTKSSFLTTNKDFIKEFYKNETFKITIKTPEGYEIVEDNVNNELDDSEKKAFEDSLNKEPEPDPEPEVENEYNIDEGYTFLKDQYGTKVLRIDIKEFNGAQDPAKKPYMESTNISINGTDFGKMSTLGFTITNYYGYELSDLTKIKSVIQDDTLNIVLTHNGKTTSFAVKNELTKEQRDEITGTEEKEPVVDENLIGTAKVKLVKSGKHNEESMSGPTLKADAEMLTDKDGNISLVMHYEPAEIMGIIAYATDLKIDGAKTEFVMKEDNSAIGIVKLDKFTEKEKVFEGHVYSSVMDSDVALKVVKGDDSTDLKEALEAKIAEVENMLKANKYYDNTKEAVVAALDEAKKSTDSINAYLEIEKSVAGLRKILEDPFAGDTVFHLNVIDTNNVTAKNIEEFAKVEVKDGRKILTVRYNSYLDWYGEIFIESTKVLNQDGEEIESKYVLDKHHSGVLQFEMPYVPGGGVFDVVHTMGNSKEVIKSQIQMDYSTIKKGVFRESLIAAIDKYGKYTADDWNTRVDMSEKKADFTKASWDVFEKALNTAKDDLKNISLTQTKLEEDIENLKEARMSLVYNIKAGNGKHANTGISGLNNPSAPYYSDPEKEYPENVGWAGSKVLFGNNGDVYRVLDTGIKDGENAGKILLMSENLRVTKPFTNEENDNVRWKDSVLRSYMNDEFYNNNFSLIEKNAILKTQIDTYDYQDGYMGPPAKDPNTKVSTEDYIFAPSMDIMSSEKYGYGSKDSRATATEYSLREVFTDMFDDVATLGVSSKGRIGGTFGLNSKKLNAPVCMNIDSKDILMTVDANTGITKGLKNAEKIDTNLWKFVMKDDSLKLKVSGKATLEGNKVKVNATSENDILAVIVEGKDFATGKIKAYGIVDPTGFQVADFNKDKDKMYLMAVSDEKGKTATASAPVLVDLNDNIEPEKPDVSNVPVNMANGVMLHESKDQPSMCDIMFDNKIAIDVKGDEATLKLLVANPVPGFPDQGKDGTVKDFAINYNDKVYKANSELGTDAKMTAKDTNALFGLTKGEKYSAQVLTVTLPKEAIKEGAMLDVAAYVNVVMMTDVNFRLKLTNVNMVDKSELEKLIAAASEDVKKTTEFTQDSINAVKVKLEEAKEALKNAKSQNDIDKAVESFKNYKELLKPQTGGGSDTGLADGKYVASATMLHENKEQNSMCNIMFDENVYIDINGDTATLKLLVANPVPAFPDQGKDGTVKNLVIKYDGKGYNASSELGTGKKMTPKESNPTFGFEKGKQYDAQVLTVQLPKAAIEDGETLTTSAYVNVVMMSDVNFRIRLTNVQKGGMDIPGGDVTPETPVEPEKPAVKPEVTPAPILPVEPPKTGADLGMDKDQQVEADKTIGDIITDILNPTVKPETPKTEAEKETAATAEKIAEAAKNNDKVKVNVETEKVDEEKAPETIKKEIADIKDKVNEIYSEVGGKLLQFANIEVTAQAIKEDGTKTDLGKLRNLDKKLSFTFQLPMDTEGNKFGVIRYHDGKAEIIPATDVTYDPVTKKITFLTDKFSTYAVFEYEKEPEVTPEPEKPVVKPGTVENVKVKTDNGLLKVTFDKVKDADSYRVYLKQAGKNWRYYITKNNSLVVKKLYKKALVKNGKYQIKVVAVNENGMSEDSQIKTIYANRIGTKSAVMFAPKFTSLTSNKGNVKAVAKKVYVKNTPNKLQYKLSYKLKGTNKWKSAGYTAKNVKNIKGLKKGKVYNFALRYRYQSSVDGKTYVYSNVVYKSAKVR